MTSIEVPRMSIGIICIVQTIYVCAVRQEFSRDSAESDLTRSQRFTVTDLSVWPPVQLRNRGNIPICRDIKKICTAALRVYVHSISLSIR